MTVQVDWPADVVDNLRKEAHKNGLSVDAFLLERVLRQTAFPGLSADATVKRRKREQAAASIRELRKGNLLGPDGTIRDLIEEGHRF